MMKRLSDFFYAHSTFYYSLVLTLAMILYAALVMGGQTAELTTELSEGQKLLGLNWGYGLNDVKALFYALSGDGISSYWRLLTIWDNIFPLIYSSMYIFWLSLLYKNIALKKQGLKLLNLYPIIPALTDLLENYLERNLLQRFIEFNEIHASEVALASGVTLLKWAFSSINYMLILVGIVVLVVSRIQNKRGQVV